MTPPRPDSLNRGQFRPDLDQFRRGITIITGTDTDVGKTIATAALAAWLEQLGDSPCVVKPAQTGIAPGEDGDLAVVGRLAGIPADRLVEWARLPEPLAPTTAARRAGVPLPSMDAVAGRLTELAAQHPCVLVEGAGGVLVGLDDDGHGLLELAAALDARGAAPRFVVVTGSGLGTLNHTQLTVNAIRAAGHEVAGLIVGAWPDSPSLAEECNATDLPAIAPILAALPAGIGHDPTAVGTAMERGVPPVMLSARQQTPAMSPVSPTNPED